MAKFLRRNLSAAAARTPALSLLTHHKPHLEKTPGTFTLTHCMFVTWILQSSKLMGWCMWHIMGVLFELVCLNMCIFVTILLLISPLFQLFHPSVCLSSVCVRSDKVCLVVNLEPIYRPVCFRFWTSSAQSTDLAYVLHYVAFILLLICILNAINILLLSVFLLNTDLFECSIQLKIHISPDFAPQHRRGLVCRIYWGPTGRIITKSQLFSLVYYLQKLPLKSTFCVFHIFSGHCRGGWGEEYFVGCILQPHH